MREPLAQLLDRTFSTAERQVIYRLFRSRGQVRHFTSDPIPIDTLQRILHAALDAPFVEDPPPWHIILVTSPTLRANITAAVAEENERDPFPRPDERGPGWFGARSRERIAAAPLHLAVTYDRDGDAALRLDPALRPSMDIYRLCWAIQNLWLAACAEGLGVEWIDLADERTVARLLALPPGVWLVAYFCLGIPRAFYVRPKQAVVDRRVRRHLASRIYADVWGESREP